MAKRKIIVYIATSADGYIARTDGSVDWLGRPRTGGDLGMKNFFKSIDTILFGRKTYDQSLKFDKKSVESNLSKTRNYVVTHKPPKSKLNVTFVNEPIKEFASRLRATPGKRHLDDGWR